jgi:hypothetical protein
MANKEIIPINEVMAKLKSRNPTFEINGELFKKTKTLRLISERGICCHYCKEEAIGFRVVRHKTQTQLRLIFAREFKLNNDFMTIDHVNAHCYSADNHSTNLVLSCYRCNNQKANKVEVKSDWLIRNTYSAFIRWFIKTECKAITLAEWHTRKIKQYVYKQVRSLLVTDFNSTAFTEACYELDMLLPAVGKNTVSLPLIQLI